MAGQAGLARTGRVGPAGMDRPALPDHRCTKAYALTDCAGPAGPEPSQSRDELKF